MIRWNKDFRLNMKCRIWTDTIKLQITQGKDLVPKFRVGDKVCTNGLPPFIAEVPLPSGN